MWFSTVNVNRYIFLKRENYCTRHSYDDWCGEVAYRVVAAEMIFHQGKGQMCHFFFCPLLLRCINKHVIIKGQKSSLRSKCVTIKNGISTILNYNLIGISIQILVSCPEPLHEKNQIFKQLTCDWITRKIAFSIIKNPAKGHWRQCTISLVLLTKTKILKMKSFRREAI